MKHLQSGFQRGSRYQVSGVVSQVALVRRFSAFASGACGGTYLYWCKFLERETFGVWARRVPRSHVERIFGL